MFLLLTIYVYICNMKMKNTLKRITYNKKILSHKRHLLKMESIPKKWLNKAALEFYNKDFDKLSMFEKNYCSDYVLSNRYRR